MEDGEEEGAGLPRARLRARHEVPSREPHRDRVPLHRRWTRELCILNVALERRVQRDLREGLDGRGAVLSRSLDGDVVVGVEACGGRLRVGRRRRRDAVRVRIAVAVAAEIATVIAAETAAEIAAEISRRRRVCSRRARLVGWGVASACGGLTCGGLTLLASLARTTATPIRTTAALDVGLVAINLTGRDDHLIHEISHLGGVVGEIWLGGALQEDAVRERAAHVLPVVHRPVAIRDRAMRRHLVRRWASDEGW